MADDVLGATDLRILEAVGRLKSFTRAAAEVGMSQPALSYRVRQLEQRIGRQLFHRHPRGVALSKDGIVLHAAASSALRQLDAALRTIENRPAGHRLRLVTDFAFAAFCLMPRMAEFRILHPGIDLQVGVSHGLGSAIDEDTDLAVLFADRHDFGPAAIRLIEERVVPICGPGFMRRQGPFRDTASLARAPLLHLEGPSPRRWYDWPSWLSDAGACQQGSNSQLSLGTYSLVVQAALADQGVALGWLGLVDPLLRQGALVRVLDLTLTSTRGYFLVVQAAGDPAALAVANWLTAAFAGDDGSTEAGMEAVCAPSSTRLRSHRDGRSGGTAS